MTKIKICGLSEVGDALAAAEAGADFLGIVFEPRSRRRLDEDDARRLVRSSRAQWGREGAGWVGVFANQPLDDVNRLLDYCEMDMAQLSGGEATDYCAQVARPVFKVVHVSKDAPKQEALDVAQRSLKTYRDNGYMCMLDTFKEGALGGTGQVFNWEVGQELARSFSFLLAGGLNPENVAEAIRRMRPWGLDVSSGVETDGRKDAIKIVQFIDLVRQTDRALTHPPGAAK